MTEQASGDGTPVDFGTLVERAEEILERLGDEETGSEEVNELLDDLEDVVDEAEDLLSTVDLREVAEAVQWENLPDAVDASDVPDAIEQGDPTEAIAIRKLLSLSDLPDLLESADGRELWREKRDLEDELDDVTGDGGDDGSITDVDVDADASRPELGDGDVDPESVEKAVQSKVSGAVGEFRRKLIEAHDRLESIREENERRFDERRTQSTSRNPTAGFSTVPSNHAGSGGTALHSTVPEETKYSTAPNRKRIYGDRFDSAEGEVDE